MSEAVSLRSGGGDIPWPTCWSAPAASGPDDGVTHMLCHGYRIHTILCTELKTDVLTIRLFVIILDK